MMSVSRLSGSACTLRTSACSPQFNSTATLPLGAGFWPRWHSTPFQISSTHNSLCPVYSSSELLCTNTCIHMYFWLYWFCVCVVRGQLWGVGSLFSPCRAQVLNSDYPAWQQAPWSAEPFHWPLSIFHNKLESRVDWLQKCCLFYSHHFPAWGTGQTPPRKATKMARRGGGVCKKKIA